MFLIFSLVLTYVNKNRLSIIHRTLYIRLHAGGYWAADGSYNGGETRCCRVDFENQNLKMLLDILSSGGFSENMSKLSYFPSSHPVLLIRTRRIYALILMLRRC